VFYCIVYTVSPTVLRHPSDEVHVPRLKNIKSTSGLAQTTIFSYGLPIDGPVSYTVCLQCLLHIPRRPRFPWITGKTGDYIMATERECTCIRLTRCLYPEQYATAAELIHWWKLGREGSNGHTPQDFLGGSQW
jgi:hypothetical protein